MSEPDALVYIVAPVTNVARTTGLTLAKCHCRISSALQLDQVPVADGLRVLF